MIIFNFLIIIYNFIFIYTFNKLKIKIKKYNQRVQFFLKIYYNITIEFLKKSEYSECIRNRKKTSSF